MIVANIVVVTLSYCYKIFLTYPGEQYTQLLADYHYGFTKRALIGWIVSLGFPVLPYWAPFVTGTLILSATAIMFLLLFRRRFGFTNQTLPLLVFTAGSPFFLKNFIQTIGYYDIYGCALALLLLLLPARSLLYVAAAALGSAALILIHHIHMLLYIPTITLIVVIRYYLQRPFVIADLVVGAGFAVALGVLFLLAQFAGTMTVPFNEFNAYLRSRMTDPSNRALALTTEMFYQSLQVEIENTWAIMPKNLLRVPVYLALIALHLPLIRYFTGLIRGLDNQRHRQIVLAGIGLICAAYVVVFVIVNDYSRWISAWFTCMILLMFAVKTLPMGREVPLIAADESRNRLLGWIASILPRVGTTIPF